MLPGTAPSRLSCASPAVRLKPSAGCDAADHCRSPKPPLGIAGNEVAPTVASAASVTRNAVKPARRPVRPTTSRASPAPATANPAASTSGDPSKPDCSAYHWPRPYPATARPAVSSRPRKPPRRRGRGRRGRGGSGGCGRGHRRRLRLGGGDDVVRGRNGRAGEGGGELVAELARLLAHLLGRLPLPSGVERPPHEQADGNEDRPQPPAVGVQGRLGEDLAVLVGQQRPGDEVDEAAETADEQQHDERAADDQRVDPEAVGDTGADAGEPSVVGVAPDTEAAKRREHPVEPGPGGAGRRVGIGHGTHAGRRGRRRTMRVDPDGTLNAPRAALPGPVAWASMGGCPSPSLSCRRPATVPSSTGRPATAGSRGYAGGSPSTSASARHWSGCSWCWRSSPVRGCSSTGSSG